MDHHRKHHSVTAKCVCIHMNKSAGVPLLHTTDSKNRGPAQSQEGFLSLRAQLSYQLEKISCHQKVPGLIPQDRIISNSNVNKYVIYNEMQQQIFFLLSTKLMERPKPTTLVHLLILILTFLPCGTQIQAHMFLLMTYL